MPISYYICPISGLSFSIKDDLPINLHSHIHPILRKPNELYNLIRKHSDTCSSQTVVGGIIYRLHEQGLIDSQEQESKYSRGQIVEQLAQESKYLLIKLFWKVYNTKAPLKEQATKISINSLIQSKSSNQMMYMIRQIADQKFELGDQLYNKELTFKSQWKREQDKKGIIGRSPKQDSMAANKRIVQNLEKLTNACPVKYNLNLIRKLKEFLKVYTTLSPTIRISLATQLATIQTDLRTNEIIHQDDMIHKSFNTVIRDVKSIDNTPIEASKDLIF